MSEAKQEPPVFEIKHREPSGGTPCVYSNYARTARTNYDLRLIFGEIMELTASEAIVEDRTAVTLPWPMVKELCASLQAHVAHTEKLAADAKQGSVADSTSTSKAYVQKKRERCMELAELAAKEQDPQKLLALTSEITRLLNPGGSTTIQ
jgi:hypothetical protein